MGGEGRGSRTLTPYPSPATSHAGEGTDHLLLLLTLHPLPPSPHPPAPSPSPHFPSHPSPGRRPSPLTPLPRRATRERGPDHLLRLLTLHPFSPHTHPQGADPHPLPLSHDEPRGRGARITLYPSL